MVDNLPWDDGVRVRAALPARDRGVHRASRPPIETSGGRLLRCHNPVPAASAERGVTDTEHEAEALLDVRDLAVHFPIKRGVVFDRTVGHVHAVDGVSLSHRPRRDLRAGRRVRLRQVHPRPGDAAARRT